MDPAKIKQLKTQAHLLKPVIIIGQSGLTEAVQQEIEITLNTHELIKIKIRADRDERNQIREQILSQSKAELIQSIGQVIVIFRKKPAPKALSHAEFLWAHNQDPMAVEKLAEGIRNFAIDQRKLEAMLRDMLS